MQKELRSKTCSLAGASDLTVVAPIRPGLIPALDSVTYKTRVKRVLRALHLGREIAHEQDFARVMSDAAERVARITSVRIAVLEPQDVVMLAVTFDGSFEAYVRTIWQKVPRLLDLVFCNTVDYIPAATSSVEVWGRWLRSRQDETQFLYAVPGVTGDDTQYFRMHERLSLREAPTDSELHMLRAPIPAAEQIADARSALGIDPTNVGHSLASSDIETLPPAFKQGIRSLVGLYRLADWYRPGTEDGRFLLRAAQELLPEFARQVETDAAGRARANERPRVKEALDWFRDGLLLEQESTRRSRPPPDALVVFRPDTIQAGILEPLEDCIHGVIALIGFPSGAGLARFLNRCKPSTRGSALETDKIRISLAFTIDGLRTAGIGASEIDALPEEFVLGMARRAGALGDVRVNHPSNWRLPALNWALGVNAPDIGDDPVPRIEIDAVHAVLQLRLCDLAPGNAAQARSALMTRLNALIGAPTECTPLSLQWLRRLHDQRLTAPNQTVDHFGFGDGLSDPVFDANNAGNFFDNHVHGGEALVGYGNAADEPPYPEASGPAAGSFAELLHNGSFLVVRKLRQDRAALDQAVKAVGGNAEETLAKMMGRWPAGDPRANKPVVALPATARSINDFDYHTDAQGTACPFHAHIRRANPRTRIDFPLDEPMLGGGRMPRLFRRSLSYGEPHNGADPTTWSLERGLVFMTYNASIGEQFEVVQGWLAGGNSAASSSIPSCPFLGVAEAGRKRHYRFENTAGAVVRMPLDGNDRLHDDPEPIVRLEWGLYAFAPSTVGLEWLARRAAGADAAQASQAAMPWSIVRGRVSIERLRAIERQQGDVAARVAWKAALEDADESAEFGSASIWAAIREDHGGVLRTPYGVLLASRRLVDDVLRDEQHAVSVRGYLPRMHDSFGEIFLGFDAGLDYDRESTPAIAAVGTLYALNVFGFVLQRTQTEVDRLVERAKAFALEDETTRREGGLPPRDIVPWDLTIDLRELVDHLLASLCEEWFGLSTEGGYFTRGGFSWAWKPGDPPSYPGHFMAPSRSFFQPHPGFDAEQVGAIHGQALVKAMRGFLGAYGAKLNQPATRTVLDSPVAGADPTYAARTLIGLIMGFAPTIDGVLRRVFAQWGNDGTLWSLRSTEAVAAGAGPSPAVERAFERAMQLRSAPELLWRTARGDLQIIGDDGGSVPIESGDVLVFGLMAATQQNLSEGRSDLTQGFGGDRTAPHRPTHACPGRDLALQAMQGFMTALVTSKQSLRPGAAPSTLAVDGHLRPVVRTVSISAAMAAKIARREWAFGAGPKPQSRFSTTVPFWAIGDSWLSDLLGRFPDLVTALWDFGYEVVDESLRRHAKGGYLLSQIAQPRFLAQIERDLKDSAQPGAQVPLPTFILLGGGGNDIVEPNDRTHSTPMFAALNQNATQLAGAINRTELDTFLTRMKDRYVEILDVLCKATKVPILIHAYDHPIPDDRRIFPGIGPWLHAKFEARNIIGPQLRIDVMRKLIDDLNCMVAAVVDGQRQQGRNVFHLRLAGMLEKQPNFGNPATDTAYQAYWHDELHPTDKGCDALAAEIARQLTAAGVPIPT